KLVGRHCALRLRFGATCEGWRQWHGAVGESFRVRAVTVCGDSARENETLSDAVEAAHNGIDITRGPIVVVTLFDFADGRNQLLHIACHHLSIDIASWPILLDDLAASYEYLSLGLPVLLPPPTTPYWMWVAELGKHAQSLDEKAELEYWQQASSCSVPALPCDSPHGENRVCEEKSQRFVLSSADTKFLLRTVQGICDVTVEEWLLSILAVTVCSWTNSESCHVTLEGYGRNELSRDL